jgi:chromosome segregation ATPase
LKTKTGFGDEMKVTSHENQQLRSENRRLTKQNVELQTLLNDTSAQLDGKSDALQKLSTQLERLQVSITKDRTTIAELEAQKRSLSTQLETKSTLLQAHTSEIKALREKNQAIASQQPFARSLELEVTRLTNENRELQRRLQVQLTETARSQSAILERRGATIDDLNSQIRALRAEKEQLSVRNMKLDEQLRASETELRELRATRSSIAEENAELSMKMSELEDDHRESRSTLARQNAELSRTVKTLQQENRKLIQQIDALNGVGSELWVLRREIKQLRKENSDLSTEMDPTLSEKDELIRELKARVASNETRIQRLQKWEDVEPVLRRIEIALERFPVEHPIVSTDDPIPDRLEAILNIIYQIRELVDEQKRGSDRRVSFPGSPRSSGFRSPRSPR